jgi:xanthine dehydrogenase accessory factor
MLLQAATSWLENGEAAVVVSLSQVRGSAPREAGTTMLVSADASIGTIGGGHLEWEVLVLARKALANGTTFVTFTKHFALGPSLGQCCGGAVDVQFESLQKHHLTALSLAQAPLFTLHLFGAGHVGRALVTVLSSLRCDVVWVDEREHEFPASIPERVVCQAVDSPATEVAQGRAGDFYLVMTHSHELDEQIIAAILRRGDAGFIGLIGSATKRARFASRLAQRGLDMASVHCPVGLAAASLQLPTSVGKEPGPIALSIAQALLEQAVKPQQR